MIILLIGNIGKATTYQKKNVIYKLKSRAIIIELPLFRMFSVFNNAL